MRTLVRTSSIYFLLFFSLVICEHRAHSQNISGVINSYVSVSAVSVNSATVTAIGPFQVGDKVLIIQMKGAAITTTNTSAFGTITSLGNAGNFEFAVIASIIGNTVTFVSNLCKSYTPSGKVQLIRVPVYSNATIVGTVTAQPWNGSTGGIVAIEATNSPLMRISMFPVRDLLAVLFFPVGLLVTTQIMPIKMQEKKGRE